MPPILAWDACPDISPSYSNAIPCSPWSGRYQSNRQRLVVANVQRRVDELSVKAPVDGIVGTLSVADRAVVLVNAPKGLDQLRDGRLADLAPTVLELLGLPQPADMTGSSLLHPQNAKTQGAAARASA